MAGKLRTLSDTITKRIRRNPDVTTRGVGGTSLAGMSRYHDLTGIQHTGTNVLDEKTAQTSAVLVRCVELIAEPASTLTLHVLNDKGERVPHYLDALFNSAPNTSMSSKAFWYHIIAGMITPKASSPVFMDRPNGSQVTALIPFANPVYPRLTDPTRNNPLGQLEGYTTRVGAEVYFYFKEEVLYFRKAGWSNFWANRSPMSGAADPVSLMNKSRAWQHSTLDSGGSVSQLIYTGKEQEGEEEFARNVNKKTRGRGNSGRIVTISGEVEPKAIPLGLTASDLSYVDSIGIYNAELPHALGLSSDRVFGQAKYENAAVADRQTWTDAIIPLLEVITTEIDLRLLTGSGLHAEFDLSDVVALRENRDSVAAEAKVMATTGAFLLDEVRERLSYSPLPGGAGQVLLVAKPAVEVKAETVEARAGETAVTVPESTLTAEPDVTEQVVTRALGGSLSPAQQAKTIRSLEAECVDAVKELAAVQVEDALQRIQRNRKKSEEWTTRAVEEAKNPGVVYERIALNDIFSASKWKARTVDALRGFGQQAWVTAGTDVADTTKRKYGPLNKLFMNRMEKSLARTADLINTTTEQLLRDRLADTDPDNIDDVSKTVREVFLDLETRRSKLIAITEAGSNYHAGVNLAFREFKIRTDKTWKTKKDSDVRKTHADLHNVSVDRDDTFGNGCRHPGDELGPASESIGCRCVLQYTIKEDDE